MSKKTKKKILVTSALPYANGPIHIGHLVEYIQTDIFVRFLRLIGEDVIYCCADDTHGTPIEIKATQLGISPEELIKKIYKEHTASFEKFLIKFDSYYTTNSHENKEYSDMIFNRLNKKGVIYKKSVEITYCEHCKRFLPDRYVKGKCPKCNEPDQYGDVCEKCSSAYKTTDLIEPYCKICHNAPVKKTSEHYFFRLSSFQQKLKQWLSKNKSLQDEIKNYIYGWINQGLEDWDITRDGPYFGFKIPGEENKYYYVWLDAPIGYIASTQNYCKQKNLDALKDYWETKNSEIHHFIGKDIIYFHFLFWPAILMGSKLKLPDSITVHGFLTVKGEKMSKSRGTFLTADEFLTDYRAEHLRFYYAKNLSKKLADINLDYDDLMETINNELLGNLGNFCFRALSFLEKNFEGKIGKLKKNKELQAEITSLIKKIKQNYSDINFNEAVKNILAISSIGNRYFQSNEPWKLIKTDKEKSHEVTSFCANIIKLLAILIEPILPNASSELKNQLNLNSLSGGDLKFNLENHKIKTPSPIIEKIEKRQAFPLKLKVAKILSVEDHPQADKLYVLKVELGDEQRQLVAGLKQHYKKEELLNKKIIVVANLKHAKLRGVESEGMLLAADDGKSVGILYAEESEIGEFASFGNLKPDEKEITFDQFEKLEIIVKEGKVISNSLILKTSKEEIKIDKDIKANAKVG